jgi:putative ABC transport system permease protein
MLVWKMATRNLTRQVGRNALSMVSIIFGVFIIVLGRGFQGGMTENMIRAQIDAGSGHVISVPADYPTTGLRHPVEDALTLTDGDRAWLDGNTTAWTERLIVAPRVIKGRKAMRARLIGVSPTDEAVFPRVDWQVEGAFPAVGAGEILIGTGPAKLLKVGLGDVLTLETRTVDGAMNAMRYTVSGIVRSGNPVIDNINLYLPLQDADALLAAGGRITHVASLLEGRDASRTEAYAAAVTAQLADSEARTWQAEVAGLMESNEIRQVMFDIMGLALMLMAATGIANTVLMAAYERVREIGTLRSMGLQRTGVLGMFALEGFWMGLIGGLIGITAAGSITAHYAKNGINMIELMGAKADAMSSVPVAAMLYMDFSVPTMVAAVVVAVVVAMGASVYPALTASRVSPADAVRAS